MTISPNVRHGALIALLLIAACAVQCAWDIRIYGARPDFVLLIAILCSQFCRTIESGIVGFAAGMLTASLASPYDGGFGSIIVSRTIVCYCIGWLEEHMFRDNIAIALALVSTGTLLAEGLFYVFDPHFPVGEWGKSVGLETAYNSCLAVPAYMLVRVCLRKKTEII